jgi:type I restriction enzyme R subunit
MTFTEASTVEKLIRDLLCGGATHHAAFRAGFARRNGRVSGFGWHYLAPANVPRQSHEVFVEDWIRSPHAGRTLVALDSDFRMNAMGASYG